MGVSTNYSAWFGSGTASAAVLTPAQVAAVAPLVRVTAAYIVMYYSFCFFQSWSKLYLFAARVYAIVATRHRRDPRRRRNAGGGRCHRTPTARSRRSCSSSTVDMVLPKPPSPPPLPREASMAPQPPQPTNLYPTPPKYAAITEVYKSNNVFLGHFNALSYSPSLIFERG